MLELLDCTDRPRFGISFLDIRVLPDYELVESLRGHALRAESYSTDEVFFWIVRAADGLRLSTRFPASFPTIEMDRFLAEFTCAIREFASGEPAATALCGGTDVTDRTPGGGHAARTTSARQPFGIPPAAPGHAGAPDPGPGAGVSRARAGAGSDRGCAMKVLLAFAGSRGDAQPGCCSGGSWRLGVTG
ncbi:hypothetical protein ACFXG4_05730 [Nocardia sp. NPDC059246]|uniref:hypothetical protein n=1 Tax=unclassified Nocardia TaxID=2637762 RepID=UPI003697A0F5